jgi:uncharacterized protein YxjI
MAEQDLARFNCPACRAGYRWKAETAGKRIQCKCGAVLRVPAQAGGLAEVVQAPAAVGASAVGQAGGYEVSDPGPQPIGPAAPPTAPVAARVPAAGGAFGFPNYTLRRKVFKFLGAAFHIYDPNGQLVFYSKQKAFKLKEDIRLYPDESMQREVLTIKARQILDISAAYDILDAGGKKVGAMRRKGLSSTFIRDQWLILDAADREIGTVVEDSTILALLRRYIDLVSLFMPQRYDVQVGGVQVAEFRQNYNPFVQKIFLDFSKDTASRLDRRIGIAAAVLMCAIEGRQR